MSISAKYNRNTERNGIEIHFDSMPAIGIRDELKRNGWRYSAYNKCWYHFYSQYNLSFAEEMCEKITTQKCDGVINRKSKKFSYNDATNSKKYRNNTVTETYSVNSLDMFPRGVYVPISPTNQRYKRKRSFFS